MIKIAFVTNSKAPYRRLQFEEFAKNKKIKISVYYTNKNYHGRKWDVKEINGVDEYRLNGFKLFKRYGYLNSGLLEIVKSNDIIMIGGYEQPTYIMLAILCKIFKKPYIVLFDGISTNSLKKREHYLKLLIKKLIIKHSTKVFINGGVSEIYFRDILKCNPNKIYNQILTVDVSKIMELAKQNQHYRNLYREKYNIPQDRKVILYSGRLVKVKNVETVVRAIANLENKEEYMLFIIGGGEEEENIKHIANKLNVQIYITGFLSNQDELFEHYFIGDALILPSIYEPWGLVINEALAAGLPVLVSSICGCSLDLVKDGYNGYIIDPYDINDISSKIEKIFNSKQKINFSKNSQDIIKEWTFKKSRESFEKMLEFYTYNKNYI